jgi:predicted DNA-binding protein
MSTKNPRINVTFEEATAALLARLARSEDKSMASLVRELALEALELREDFYLSKVAEKLDKKGAKTYNHEDAWK